MRPVSLDQITNILKSFGPVLRLGPKNVINGIAVSEADTRQAAYDERQRQYEDWQYPEAFAYGVECTISSRFDRSCHGELAERTCHVFQSKKKRIRSTFF